MSIMDDIGDAALGVLKLVAPTVATALGGPLAGVAVKALGDMLLPGEAAPTPAQIATAVTALPPDQMVKLREIETKFLTDMKAADIELERLAYADTANARAREIAVKDETPAILALCVTLGFFGALAFMFLNELPSGNKDYLLVALGALGGAWASIVSYYFGSSRGSDRMKDLMQQGVK